VPSVSVSEISHIPISRCFTVSRLDRIRRLQRSMVPLGVGQRQRCVASSSAGRRAAPGLCPAWSVDEASLPCLARRFMTQGNKIVRISKMKNYIRSAQVFTVDCSMLSSIQCVRMIFEMLHFFSFFFLSLLLQGLYFSQCDFHLQLWVTLMFNIEAVWHSEDQNTLSLLIILPKRF